MFWRFLSILSLFFPLLCLIISLRHTFIVVFCIGGRMDTTNIQRNSPSRKKCEEIIKRILITEVLEHGRNEHFKSASDFMSYFESLYPASDALVKQVQRAIKALDMPKDPKGYFLVNKTNEQFSQEKEISSLLLQAEAKVIDMEELSPVFIRLKPHLKQHIIHILSHSLTFQGKFTTLMETHDGLIIFTQNKQQLLILLNSLIS